MLFWWVEIWSFLCSLSVQRGDNDWRMYAFCRIIFNDAEMKLVFSNITIAGIFFIVHPSFIFIFLKLVHFFIRLLLISSIFSNSFPHSLFYSVCVKAFSIIVNVLCCVLCYYSLSSGRIIHVYQKEHTHTQNWKFYVLTFGKCFCSINSMFW